MDDVVPDSWLLAARSASPSRCRYLALHCAPAVSHRVLAPALLRRCRPPDASAARTWGCPSPHSAIAALMALHAHDLPSHEVRSASTCATTVAQSRRAKTWSSQARPVSPSLFLCRQGQCSRSIKFIGERRPSPESSHMQLHHQVN